jgi:hypothetical protein
VFSRLSSDIAVDADSIVRSPGGTAELQLAALSEPALRGLELDELPRLAHNRYVALDRQDRVLAATLRAFRAGPASVWGPVVLEMLAPALVKLACRTLPVSPGIDEEDIQQQVIYEALRAATMMPLPPDCRFVQARLVKLANKRLRRWLAREQRRQDRHLSLEGLDEEDAQWAR